MGTVRHRTQVVTRLLHVTGLLVAAGGILTLFITDSVDSPVIWVGPIVFVAVATLILLRPGRSTLGLGLGFSLFVLVGAFIAPGLLDRLSDPTNAGAFYGTATQITGLLLALVTGGAALQQHDRA